MIEKNIACAEQKESTFNISVNSNNGFSTIRTQLIIPKAIQSTWGSNPLEHIPIADKMVLASICYSNGQGMSSLSKDFYSDIDNSLHEIKDYDVVYVIRAEFLDK